MATLAIYDIEDEENLSQSFADPRVKPQSLREIDVSPAILEDLALKTLYAAGVTSLYDLAKTLHLSYSVTQELVNALRTNLCCQVCGMESNVPNISISASGRARAADLFTRSRYLGPAPVSFDSYVNVVRQQSVEDVKINAAGVSRAFRHLVLDHETLRQLGTAMNSGSTVFLYGPPGLGKRRSPRLYHEYWPRMRSGFHMR